MFQTCPKCNRECSTDTPVCPRCGHRYFGEPTPPRPTTPPPERPPEDLLQSGMNLYRAYDYLKELGSIALLGVGLIVLAVFAFTGFGTGRPTATDVMYGGILALVGLGVFWMVVRAFLRGPGGGPRSDG